MTIIGPSRHVAPRSLTVAFGGKANSGRSSARAHLWFAPYQLSRFQGFCPVQENDGWAETLNSWWHGIGDWMA